MAADLSTLTSYLPANVEPAVREIEAAVADGVVPNKMFTDAKFILNRAVEKACEAFLATGPHEAKHGQSDWWLGAYDADAFVSGLHNLPAALKRAQKAGNGRGDLTDYAAFLTTLLPLRELLESAKPLIKKRGELPVVKTATQIADDADRMTCQCCGRPILSNTGTVAHHGYERPTYGWQTASCMGAKKLPFEVDRKQLGRLIVALYEMMARMQTTRDQIADEVLPVTRDHTVGFGKTAKRKSFSFTRENFSTDEARKALREAGRFEYEFDELLKVELAFHDSRLRSIASDIKMQQKRYDNWKQTHEWKDGEWAVLKTGE